MIGGGMRQAGVIAAAGLYALRNNITKLSHDHDNTKKVYASLMASEHIRFSSKPETNMLFLDSSVDMNRLSAFLAEHHIRTAGARWVFHQDISVEDVNRLIEVCRLYEKTVPTKDSLTEKSV